MAEWISSCLLLIVKSIDMALNIRYYMYYHYWNYYFLNRAVSWFITLIQIDIVCNISLNNINQQESL